MLQRADIYLAVVSGTDYSYLHLSVITREASPMN